MYKKFFLPLIMLLVIASCKKDPNSDPYGGLIKQWDVHLSTQYENPAIPGRSETGTATITLHGDNSLHYTVTIDSLLSGDAMMAGHIHFGDPLTNGPVFINLNPVFSGNKASGSVMLDDERADSLQTMPIYINFHSTMHPAGLVRAQMDKTIDFAADVLMTGNAETPAVTTSATGLGQLRLMTDKTLYSKISITGVEAGDTLTLSHIHGAPVGTPGPVLVPLGGTIADFGVVKVHTLTDAVINTIKTSPTYLNAHSVMHPMGIVRGQIR